MVEGAKTTKCDYPGFSSIVKLQNSEAVMFGPKLKDFTTLLPPEKSNFTILVSVLEMKLQLEIR